MEPSSLFDDRSLPSKDGDVDWDVVAPRYHECIMGPFSPEMVELKGGKTRNLLLDYLECIPIDESGDFSIADFGCGPGNLLPFIAEKKASVTGIDRSQSALSIARKKAEESEIEFKSIQADILDLDVSEKFDLIISVNSIIPNRRDDVVRLLTKMRDCLKATGTIAAILPSFDTTEYLLDLWEAHHRRDAHNAGHAAAFGHAFKAAKKMCFEEKSYADDGVHAQCYHTPETIAAEFAMAGLRLLRPPKKVHYPWDLTRKFDYGFFPDAGEEIWDWFVVAEREEQSEAI